MVKQPFDETFNKLAREIGNGISAVMNKLQLSMQEYLRNNIDIKQLLKMVEGMGLPLFDRVGMLTGATPGFNPYKILGLEKTASNTEIKDRYLEIMLKIHPDKAGKEMTFLSALVNTAYGIICKERGI